MFPHSEINKSGPIAKMIVDFIASIIIWIIVGVISHWGYFIDPRYSSLAKHFFWNNWVFTKHLILFTDPDNALNISKELRCINKNGALSNLNRWKLLLFNRELIEKVLNSNLNKSFEYKYISSWLKTGILTSDYDKWRIRKKLLTPAFHKDILIHHMDVFANCTHVLIEKLDQHADGSIVDIQTYIKLCTLDCIVTTALGVNMDIQNNPDKEYKQCVETMCNVLYTRTFTYLMVPIFYKMSALRRKELHASTVLNNFTSMIISKRRLQPSDCDSTTILDILLAHGELNDEDICEELNSFIFAGQESTGITLSFALYALSTHPDIQAKVYEEIVRLVGLDNTPTYNDIQNLTFMDQVLKETMRLYPSAPVIARRIDREITWQDAVLPKGLQVFIMPYVTHREPEIFPDPEKFNPERFSEANIQKIPNCAYIPFSSGARSCIGKSFALLEMKFILIHVLRRYQILSAGEKYKPILLCRVILESKNGIQVRLKRRN